MNNFKNFKKKFDPIILFVFFIIFVLLIYTTYKSEIFYKGLQRDYYYKYYISLISFSFIFFSLIFFKKKN